MKIEMNNNKCKISYPIGVVARGSFTVEGNSPEDAKAKALKKWNSNPYYSDCDNKWSFYER